MRARALGWVLLMLASGQVAAQLPPTVGADAYTVNAHGLLTVNAASGVLANDTGFNPATHRLESFDPVSQYGAPIALAADGSFTYDPPVGFAGRDTFGYTVRNAYGSRNTVVTIDVSGDVVWFVDDNAPAGGDGTFGSPFNSLAPLNGAAGTGDADAINQVIFLYEGTYSGVEFDLESGQRLIGHGLGLDLVGTQNDVAAGATPVLTSSSSFPVIEIFGQNGQIRGLHVQNSGGWAIRSSTGPNGNYTIADVVLAPSGGASGAMELLNSTGTQTLTNISINGALNVSSPALQFIGTSGTMTLTNVDVGTGSGFTGGYVLNVSGNNATITFDSTSTLNSTSTRGLNIGTLMAAGSVTLPVVNIAGGVTSEPLVRLQSNNAASTVNFAGGVVATTTGTDSTAFLSDGGRLTIGGTSSTLSATDGPALYLEAVELTANATFASLSSNSSNARGISIEAPVGSNDVIVTGTTTLGSPTTQAIRVNSTAASGFLLNLATLNSSGGTAGIEVNNAAVTVSNSASTLTTSAGPAIICNAGTTNLAFTTLTAAGGTNGVSFTSCGGTVNATGGTLTSTAGASNDVVLIEGSTLSLTYGGGVSKNTAGRAVAINGLTTPGLVTFNGIVTGSNVSGGVSIQNSTRNVTFTTLNLGTAGARFSATPVALAGNTGRVHLGNVAIYTNGATGLDIAYANASPGRVSSSASSIIDVTGNAVALSVSHATAQELSLQFASVISTGAGTHGISLNRATGLLRIDTQADFGAKTTAAVEISNSRIATYIQALNINGAFDGVKLSNNSSDGTYTNEFVIMGDLNFVDTHTNGMGGTFTNIVDNAFDLTNTTTTRVTDLIINGTGSHAVTGTGVNGNTIFSNVDMTAIGNADNEHVFNFRDGALSGAQVSGSLEVNNSIIQNFTDNGVYLENFADTLDFRWTDNTLRNNITTIACGGGNCNGNGILLRADGTARINAFIQNAVFEDIDGIALTANPEGSSGARMDIAVVSSAFTAEPYGGPSHTNNGEVAISLRNAQGNSTLNFRLFSNDIYNYTGEFALGIVAIEGGDFTTTNGVVSDLYIYHAHAGDAVGIFSDGANTAGSGTTNYDLILSFNNVRTPGGTAGSSFYFSGNGAISGSDANAQITLLNSQFPSSPSKAFWRTVDLTFDSGSANFNRACFNLTGNQVAAGSSGLPAIDLYYISNTQVRLQGMTGTGDVNAIARLNATNTLGNSAAVSTLNNITSATCTTPTLPVVFPFN